jgi:acyl-coenzyme A synthetase/AMP-(fatty) acid ligase
MARPDGHRDANYLTDIIADASVTVLHFVPSMLQVFVTEADVKRCASLRLVICSGEALPADLQRRFFAHLHADLHNLYGPTEAAIDVTSWQCTPGDEQLLVPIGRPIANIQIHLLNAYLQPVPMGAPGELYIGGIGLARGYWHRAALTAERFVPDPFSQEPGRRLYRTGDLARYRTDGAIEFLGRLDQQVKVRGFRIELGEIEHTLEQQAAVREAVVLVREDTPDNKRLVAYLVPTTPDAFSWNDVRAGLQEHLPNYMVPTIHLVLENFPLTPNGKVDRRALPAPDTAALKQGQSYVAPRTSLEELLAQIWSELLGQTNVGIYDSFFELGGHSLLATQVVSRIKQSISIDLPIRMLFESPRIIDLSPQIEVLQREFLQQADDEHLAQLLVEIGETSDDDLLRLLADDQE